jgi:hypothetical protein
MRNKDSFTLKDLFEGENLYSLITGFVLLGFSFVFEHFASVYAFAYSLRPTSTYVGDLLLDNLLVVDLNFIIVEGALLAIVAGAVFVAFFRPRYVLFILKSLALFIAIRALFISFTHIGIYPEHIDPGVGIFDGIYTYLNFQTGFFFSGHTGMSFLIALIFWKSKLERNIFLSLSFIFAIAVLLAHIHYSIDVFAAPFMAYGIYHIALHLFKRDHELIEQK